MKRILIVDDQADIRRMVRLALQDVFATDEAENAQVALERICSNPPDGMVLDVMMPGEMDGLDLCRHIKGVPALEGIYVALVTARGQVEDQERGRKLGADAYFVKPFSPLSLARHLQSALLR